MLKDKERYTPYMKRIRAAKGNSLYPYVAIAAMLLIPLMVLTGWVLDIPIIRSVLPGFTPMNPITATCFLLVGIAFLAHRLLKNSSAGRLILNGTGLIVLLVGLLMLIKYMGGVDLQIDRILFESKLGINRMAVTTSFDFFLLGICLIAYPRLSSLTRLIAISIGGVATYALIAYLYNFAGIYGQTIFNPMALHTALLFLVSSLYVFSMQRFSDWEVVKMLRAKNLLAPLSGFVIFLITVVVAAGFAFTLKSNIDHQAVLAFESQTLQLTENLSGKINLYINPLYGLQGLFNASENVEVEEWDAYVASLNIPTNYVGISSVTYAQKLYPDELDSVPFEVYPAGTRDFYLPITYFTTFIDSVPPYGFDYTSDPIRLAAYTKAVEKGTPVATPVILGVTSRAPLFSAYMPVYEHASARDEKGLLSVSFRLERIFPPLIDENILFTDDMAVSIYESANPQAADEPIYKTKGSAIVEPYAISRADTIEVGGRTWTIVYGGTQTFGQESVEKFAPSIVFVIGLLLSLLFGYLAFGFVQSRERALSTKNTQLRNVIDQMPFGFLLEDENRKVLFANENLLTVFDGAASVPVRSLIGADTRELAKATCKTVKEYDSYVARIEEIISAHHPVFNEKVEMQNGRFISRDYVPLIDRERQIGGMWTFKDITEEENVDRMKTEFVSLASHQLRTPLTSIKWYTELLLEESGELSGEQKEYAEEIKEASFRMNNLVGALLDVSRLDLGTFMIEPKESDILAIMQQAVHEQQPSIAKKKQSLSFDHPETLPKVALDTKLFFIIIQNLLSNAHKYSPEGSKLTLGVSQNEKGSFVITCSDTGYGIPKEQQASIFKKLFRADNIRSLDVEGTGLGLYMIKTIVDAAGCAISFTSQEGKGTTFVITIPATGMKSKTGTRTIGE